MMLRSITKVIASAVLMFLLSLQSVSALDEVTYRAMLEKDKVNFGEQVQFLVLVNFGRNTMPPAISAPSFVQFEVLSENERVEEAGEGEEKYKILKHIWLLKPTESGRLSIASAIVTYQDPTSNLLRNGKTDIVFLQVAPIEENSTTPKGQTVADTKGNSSPAQGKMIYLGAGVLVVLLLGIGLVLGMGKRKPVAPKVVHEDPALEALQAAIAYAESEELEKYYAAISRALLDYLQNKYSLDAHVINTTVLMEKLSGFGIPKANLQGVEEFLKVADKAKFAGYVPTEDKMIELHGIVKDFIEVGRKIKIKQAKPVKKKKDEEDD